MLLMDFNVKILIPLLCSLLLKETSLMNSTTLFCNSSLSINFWLPRLYKTSLSSKFNVSSCCSSVVESVAAGIPQKAASYFIKPPPLKITSALLRYFSIEN